MSTTIASCSLVATRRRSGTAGRAGEAPRDDDGAKGRILRHAGAGYEVKLDGQSTPTVVSAGAVEPEPRQRSTRRGMSQPAGEVDTQWAGASEPAPSHSRAVSADPTPRGAARLQLAGPRTVAGRSSVSRMAVEPAPRHRATSSVRVVTCSMYLARRLGAAGSLANRRDNKYGF